MPPPDDPDEPLDQKVARALNSACDALHGADNDYAKLLAMANAVESLVHLGDNGSGAINRLRDTAIANYGVTPAAAQTAIDRGMNDARMARSIRAISGNYNDYSFNRIDVRTDAIDDLVVTAFKKDDAIITATVEFAKDMAEGSTFVSHLKVLQLRPDPDEPNGDWITSCIIEPIDAEAKQNKEKQAQPDTQTKKAPKDKWRSSRLRKALLNALASNGTDINPFADGTKVRGVLLQTVRDEFSRAYPADGETEKLRRKATGEAWRRELKEFSNPEHPCIGVWEIESVKWVWLITQEFQS